MAPKKRKAVRRKARTGRVRGKTARRRVWVLATETCCGSPNYAARGAFADYLGCKAPNTIRIFSPAPYC